ncbi:MAG: DUF1579 domain-containing protein [Planctomycetes bacterium]|nr:DUF1579 domain-containing protein [Planctomycetota bacterium]
MKGTICRWMLGTGLATALIFTTTGCESGGFLWWDDDDTTKAQAQDAQVDADAMMEAWMAFGQPGPQHEWMKKFEGTWGVTGSASMAPGEEPMPMSGTSTYTMILDGRFLKEHHVSDSADMPFQGLGYLGFDNSSHKYVGIWMDSTTTAIMRAEGTFDEATGKLVTTGSYYDPISATNKTMRGETWFVDDDTIQADMFQPGPDGTMYMTMTMQYRRK